MTSNTPKIDALVNAAPLEECRKDFALLNDLVVQHQNRIKINSSGIDQLFAMNNKYTHNIEYGKHCGSCRARVWKRVSTNIYQSLKNRLDNEA